MGMMLDPVWILVSLVVSGAGFVVFSYGRKQQRWPHMIGGGLIVVLPYFVTGPIAMVLVSLAIGAAIWAMTRLDW
jgi:hypothetical protein